MKKKEIITNCLILTVLVTLTFTMIGFSAVNTTATVGGKAIYQGNQLSNNVSLMINVYWGTEFLPSMLDTLDKYNVKCTFFFGGSWVDDNNAILTDIYERGHEIGNHGYFHKDHSKISSTQNAEEINKCANLIKHILGVEPILFAPPSGAFNNDTLNYCETRGYKVIMWSKDTIDWRDKDSEKIYTRATSKVKGGDLILMHPTKCTAEALPRILDFYKQNNLVATTVSNTLK